MTFLKLKIFTLLFFVLALAVNAEEASIIKITDATIAKEKLYFFSNVYTNGYKGKFKPIAESFMSIIVNDFGLYKHKFQSFKMPKFEQNSIDYKKLEDNGGSFLISAKFKDDEGKLFYDIKLSNILQKSVALNLTGYIQNRISRAEVHKISDKLLKKIAGVKKTIFTSKIVFVSDFGSTRKKPFKELYMMDFDGQQIKRLTYHRGTVISPAVSNDKSKVLYSLIKKQNNGKSRNVNLYILDLVSGKSRLLSKRKGLNSGAVFMPGGKSILLTLSHLGNAEIYKMELSTKKLIRVTKHYSIDVDPSISRDGSLLTFLSGRSGKPMIYTLDPRGTEKSIKRISYVGRFNATPRFSPDGKEIVFSSWLDQRFDLFRINSDGTGLSRLTKNFGSNEDPTYSNDGEFIAFSSQRVLSRTKATHNIYVMDKDGEILGPITKNFGNCVAPRWSK